LYEKYSGFIVLINAGNILGKAKLGFRLMREYFKLVIQDNMVQYKVVGSAS